MNWPKMMIINRFFNSIFNLFNFMFKFLLIFDMIYLSNPFFNRDISDYFFKRKYLCAIFRTGNKTSTIESSLDVHIRFLKFVAFIFNTIITRINLTNISFSLNSTRLDKNKPISNQILKFLLYIYINFVT